ncbi:MAG: hypothetical protein H6726_11315 [Sandaracinaceae bacterium]|nr:hypothetical protein [Sandaracinaceae bacterium]
MAEGEPALVTAYENYDGEGNARLVRDPLGQETTLTYDGLGRLTDVTLPAPLGEVAAGLPRLLSTHAAYDGGDCVTAVTETLEPDGGGAAFTRELTWDHDAFGRMTRHGQRGRDVTYTYNDSLRQMAQASSGGTTLYQYDALGRIDWAELDGDRVDVSYVEHEDLVSTVTNPNGTVATFGYDAATRRLTGVTHTRGGTPFLAYGYAYDHNGNRTLETVTEGGSEERNEYTYDALDRMTLHRRETGATPGPEDIRETRYAFELSGARGYNRRVEDVQDGGGQELARRVYDYDGANRLTTLSETGGATRTVTYAHDANGNRLSRVDSAAGGEQTLYRYTVQNQLSEVLAGPAGAEVSQGQYEYDALGRRVRQHGTQRGDIETVYDGLSTLDEHEVSGGGAGTPLGHYHYALGLARLDEGGGEERYYHLDGRGNTGALTAGSGGADTPGDVLTSYRLDPFGAVRSGSDPVNRQVYTGHETDTETGLIYMNARHYDPETGRFVTQDTWLGTGGDPGTQNRYAYALGNPATYWDPTGHWTEVYPGGCTSGKDKCEQAAGGQGGIPYPEDSSVIPLGGPSPSSAAPAPQTQAARPTPPAPRGTYSVISSGITPAQVYNAAYSWVQSRRQVLEERHAEITQRIDERTRVTGWWGERRDYTSGAGYAANRGWDPNQQPIDTSNVPTMSPFEMTRVYTSESMPTALELEVLEGVNLLFSLGEMIAGSELGGALSTKRNYERLSELLTFLAVLEDSPEVLIVAIMRAPQAFIDRYRSGDSATVGSVLSTLYQSLGGLAQMALGTAVGAIILKNGVNVVDEAVDGASEIAQFAAQASHHGPELPGPSVPHGGTPDVPGGGLTPGGGVPTYDTPFRPLTRNQRRAIQERVNNRTASREDLAHLDWDRRFNNRRRAGVRRFWAAERQRLRDGLPGTREWTSEQREAILAGRTPQHNGAPIEGHHMYNALDHPHIANDPTNIHPATDAEHLGRWHGGNYQNDTFGAPLNPDFPEDF